MDTNKQNITYLGNIMSACNKQHLSNIWDSIMTKLSNAEAELKKSVAFMKKKCIIEKARSR